MDFTQLEAASDGNENLLVVTDVFTKFAVAVPTRDQGGSTVVKALVCDLFLVYGVPKGIHSYQGRCFEAEVVQELCRMYGIKKSRSTPYHPERNGECERLNRILHGLLRTSHLRERESGLSTSRNCVMHIKELHILLPGILHTAPCLMLILNCQMISYSQMSTKTKQAGMVNG